MKKTTAIIIGILIIVISIITIFFLPSNNDYTYYQPHLLEKNQSSIKMIADKNFLDFPTSIGILPYGRIISSRTKR